MRKHILVLILTLACAAPAVAQDGGSRSRLIISNDAIARGLAAHPPAAAKASRDSVKNGAIIGAVIGGAIFGGFVTFLCNALQEPSDPSCLGSSLFAIGIGAGGGAAAGAGIDALLERSPSARPSWRVTATIGRAPQRF